MLVIQSALIAFGHPLSTFMGLASSQDKSTSFSWRWPIAFQGFFLILILIALPFLPESPRWLVSHDRVEEATAVFAQLEGKTATVNDPKIIRERDLVVASVQHEREVGEVSWAEVFTEGKNRNLSRVLLGAGPYMYVPCPADTKRFWSALGLIHAIGSTNGPESIPWLISFQLPSSATSVCQRSCLW